MVTRPSVTCRNIRKYKFWNASYETASILGPISKYTEYFSMYFNNLCVVVLYGFDKIRVHFFLKNNYDRNDLTGHSNTSQ